MRNIFVNLKRFDVPKSYGGICPMEDSAEWIKWVVDECIKNKLGNLSDMELTLLLPELLIITARERLLQYGRNETGTLNIGSQGVYREDVKKGGNFGAFTTNLPSAAVKSNGCKWTIIGHSEERKDKLGIISLYDPETQGNEDCQKRAKDTVDVMISQEVTCAFGAGLNVLMCVGETSEEKGEGSLEEQKPRIRSVLKSQLQTGLKGAESAIKERRVVIGYEPIWAIGPGKTPPGKEYIGFVSAYIKDVIKEICGFEIPVVYGGGLKEENAEMISGIETIDGGLVALTRFTGDIGFEPEGLSKIIAKYNT